jgi:hypothetical protein
MRHGVAFRGVGLVRTGITCALAASLIVGSGNISFISAAPSKGDESGAISVTSDPVGATVYVDGRFIGQTPIDVPSLAAGDHRVRLVMDGYLENGRIVTVNTGKTETLNVRLSARAQDGAAQITGLKIVVLEGEDAVNIIDKKTAVKPTVEVRDKNDLPVSGATVTFMINGGRNAATFANGLRQVTVTTDSFGRATITELNPLGRGAFQIQARAAYQGQTATATIHQTNFATTAQAAKVGKAPGQAGQANGSPGAATNGSTGAAASGAAGAAGGGVAGGLSHAAIIGIGAAAAGGLTTAVAVSKRGGADVAASPCTYSLSPSTQSAAPEGGTFTVFVTAGCGWSATTDQPWLAIGSGGAGSGSGTITYSIAANTARSSRTGHITLTGAGGTVALTVTQDALSATFTGTVASAGTTPFGGPPYCFYSITLTNITSTLTLDGTSATEGQVTLQATENALAGCPYRPYPPHTHTYTLISGAVTGASVAVQYQPSSANAPRASLTFTGTLSADNRTLTGTLTWHRTDEPSPLDWTVSTPVSMTLSR